MLSQGSRLRTSILRLASQVRGTIPSTLERGEREREIFIDNLLVRVHLIIEMSRPALRHGSLNSLFLSSLVFRSHLQMVARWEWGWCGFNTKHQSTKAPKHYPGSLISTFLRSGEEPGLTKLVRRNGLKQSQELPAWYKWSVCISHLLGL